LPKAVAFVRLNIYFAFKRVPWRRMRLNWMTTTSNDHDSNELNSPPGTRNVRRTLAILRAVAKYQGKGSQLSRIARAVDLPISTAKRILSVLAAEGILTFHKGSRQYYLGQELYEMIKPILRVTLQEKYHSVLERIATQTQDSVYLVVPSGLEAVCIDVAEGALAVRIPYGIGSSSPLGLMSSGLAILAALPDKDIESIIAKNQTSYAEYHLTKKEIREQIANYRRKGYILYKSHYIDGLVGLSMPILDDQNQIIASITDSSTVQRMTKERIKLIKEVIETELAKIER
jgi:DNA-binding IclR family transcriptional regulator